MALPPLPSKNEIDWYAKRTAFDNEIGRLSTTAMSSAEQLDVRVDALELMGGTSPGDVSDGTIASVLQQPDSLSSSVVAAAIAEATKVKADKPPVLEWTTDVVNVATHRLGGAHMIQCTAAAARANMAMGANTLDIDVRVTADGELIVAHNNYLNGYTTKNAGTWESLHSTQLPGVQWVGDLQHDGTWPNQDVSTLEDFFREFGNRMYLAIEIKNVYPTVYPKTLNEVDRLATKYNVRKSVIVLMYAQYYADFGPLVKAKGLLLHTYFDSAFPGHNDPAIIPTYTPLSDMIALSSIASDSTISAWVATGKSIWVSPSGRQHRWDELRALGVKGMVDDNALHAAAYGGAATLSPYEIGLWGNGDLPTKGDVKPTLSASGGLRFNADVADWQCMLMGDYSRLPTSYNLDFQVRFDTIVGGTPWFGFLICGMTDKSVQWFSDPSPGAYQMTFHPKTGKLGLYKKVNGVNTTLIVTDAGTIIPEGGTVYGRISITPSGITLEQRTSFGGGSVIVSKSTTDTTFRGSFTHALQFGRGSDATLVRFKR